MATNYNARIATRGLALSVDAANPASLDPSKIVRNMLSDANFSSNNYTRVASTVISGITDPNGSATAYRIREDTTNGGHGVQLPSFNFVAGTRYCISFYARAAELTTIQFQTNASAFGGASTTEWNLSTGAVGLFNQTGTAAITNAGNGWYRCSISATATATTNTSAFFLFGVFQGSNGWLGDGTKGLSVWGPQIEYGTVPTTYSPNTTSTIVPTWNDLTGTSRPIPLVSSLTSVEYLIVAGGGGGGQVNSDNGGGGGGGGGVLTGTVAIVPQTYTVTVGAGGRTLRDAVNDIDAVGGNSSFGSLVAFGGGYGGGYINGNTIVRFPGYFGGSSGGSSVNQPAISPTPAGQGNIGGFGLNGWGGGGGGGAGGAGGTTTATTTAIAGAGGPGILSSISGTATFYGGGGGGGGSTGRQSDLDLGGPGGVGGGGRGGTHRVNSTAGTPNTGGGGGGGGGGQLSTLAETFASPGGSGIVIIRYLGPQKAVGGIVTSVGGFTIHTFTNSGTFTPTSPPSTNVSYGSFVNVTTPILYDSRNSGSLVFNNLDNYVSMPELSSQTNSPLSVFAWVFLNATPVGTKGIWGYYGVNNNNCHFEINPTATRLRLGDINKSDLPMLAIGSWQFIGFTSTGTTHSYYVNGVLSATWSGTTGTILGSNGTFPSSHDIGRSDAGRVWNGRIAHVTIYNAELTAAEVLNNFNALRGRYAV
jgi:hypothetical protein